MCYSTHASIIFRQNCGKIVSRDICCFAKVVESCSMFAYSHVTCNEGRFCKWKELVQGEYYHLFEQGAATKPWWWGERLIRWEPGAVAHPARCCTIDLHGRGAHVLLYHSWREEAGVIPPPLVSLSKSSRKLASSPPPSLPYPNFEEPGCHSLLYFPPIEIRTAVL